MATARIEQVLPEPPPKKVVLELSEWEAGVLLSLTGRCVGPFGMSRGATDAVFNALDAAGVKRVGIGVVDTIYLF